jgi:hypothetical protein
MHNSCNRHVLLLPYTKHDVMEKFCIAGLFIIELNFICAL